MSTTTPAPTPIPARPLPCNIAEPHAAEFWSRAARGKLEFQVCTACKYLRWPSAAICPECWSADFTWQAVSPRGALWSYAVYHRAFHPAFAQNVPYVVGLVELDAGPRMIANIVGVEPSQVRVGMQLLARLEKLSEELGIVNFAPE